MSRDLLQVRFTHTRINMAYGVMAYRWLRLVGSFHLNVTFADYSLFYRALLQMSKEFCLDVKRPPPSVIYTHTYQYGIWAGYD